MASGQIPLTVIGGYLGAGKTTVLNRLLSDPGGRRLGVIVNDFGALGIDAALLDTQQSGVVNLPNGCVCCTLGTDLYAALNSLATADDPPDQIVIEASGVADPVAVAAWSTVPPFVPGGVVVLAAADSVQRQAVDRYVGSEVVRQLAGADVVIVSKSDIVTSSALANVVEWCAAQTDGTPVVVAPLGAVPADVVLGQRPDAVAAIETQPHADVDGHVDSYARWAWESDSMLPRAGLDRFLAGLPPSVLRLKGFVGLDDGSWLVVDVVGRRIHLRPTPARRRSQLEAIAVGSELELSNPG